MEGFAYLELVMAVVDRVEERFGAVAAGVFGLLAAAVVPLFLVVLAILYFAWR